MAKKKKFYVVWQGHNPGIYDSWDACQEQIRSYPNAKYKSFLSKDDALIALHGDYDKFIQKKSKKSNIISAATLEKIVRNTWSVDAACSGNPGIMEYRGVITDTGQELFRQGPFSNGTNNIGEFLAIVHALALLKKQGDHSRIVYTDSRTAMAWVRNKKVKTVLVQDHRNKIIFELIDRAINWLKKNEYKNQILKWETKVWGEIPADFGRK